MAKPLRHFLRGLVLMRDRQPYLIPETGRDRPSLGVSVLLRPYALLCHVSAVEASLKPQRSRCSFEQNTSPPKPLASVQPETVQSKANNAHQRHLNCYRRDNDRHKTKQNKHLLKVILSK